MMFANDKWTRNEQGTAMCAGGGTAQVTITAEYPLPEQMHDPIALLTGRGSQTVGVVSTPAGRMNNRNAKISSSDSRSPSISDSASVLITSSCGSRRRSARISPKYSFNVADAAIPM